MQPLSFIERTKIITFFFEKAYNANGLYYTVMWNQVEFLLEGSVLPMTIEELKISDRFLLEAAYPKNQTDLSLIHI